MVWDPIQQGVLLSGGQDEVAPYGSHYGNDNDTWLLVARSTQPSPVDGCAFSQQ